MERNGIKKVSGYKCLNCESIIDEVNVSINFNVRVDVETFIEEDLTVEKFEHMIEEPTITCPHCGADLE